MFKGRENGLKRVYLCVRGYKTDLIDFNFEPKCHFEVLPEKSKPLLRALPFKWELNVLLTLILLKVKLILGWIYLVVFGILCFQFCCVTPLSQHSHMYL